MKLGIVAAVEAELGGLPGVAVGVGPLRAAASTARLLAGDAFDGLVLVGSAGSYPGGPAVGSVVVSRWMGWADAGSITGKAYAPVPVQPLLGASWLRERTSAPEADILTVPSITTDPEVVAALQHQGKRTWQVEHLEAMGVAVACAAAGTPFVALLGIANRVGPTAHGEWKANRDAAEGRARAAVQELLRRCAGP